MNPLYSKTKIAVVGATGNVGRALLRILAERGCPKENVFAVASDRSTGKEISFGEEDVLPIVPLTQFDFTNVNIALFSPGSKISEEYAPKAASQGCIVIDNTSHFRMDPDVPLIIPEINKAALSLHTKRNIIANPNCSTIQLLMALSPLHAIAPIKRVVACTYQSVSGAGKEAMSELLNQTKSIFVNQTYAPAVFNKTIAFNVIPQIDILMDDGQTKEEWKMAVETKKILDPSIELVATCVRVPVFIGHAVAAHVEFASPLSVSQARTALKNAPGVQLIDDSRNDEIITPLECVGEDPVYVNRIRQDTTVPHGLSLWIVADNVRKGAALNAIQIAEELLQKFNS